MSTHDTLGREWARVDQVVVGSVLVPDGCFTSLIGGAEYVVLSDEHGLFLRASQPVEGSDFNIDFYLEGQLTGKTDDDKTHYVGLYFIR